jgi:hypothetical protein
VLQQPPGEFRFRGEQDLVRDPGQLAALLVGRPVLGQVQGPAGQGVPVRGRIGEGDLDLAHRDAPDRAAVLAGCPCAVRGRLRVRGLVHDQDRVDGVAGEVTCGPCRGGVQHLPVIDARAGQQVLHPVRPRVPGCLRDRPAVVILEFHQEAVHHVTAGQAGLPPGETRSDPAHQVLQKAGMRVMIYAGASGCRRIVLFHKLA